MDSFMPRDAREVRLMQACLVACTIAATEGVPVSLGTYEGPLGTVITTRTDLDRYAVSLHVDGVHRWTLDTGSLEQARKLAISAAFGHFDGAW